jgi:hypothetical protein
MKPVQSKPRDKGIADLIGETIKSNKQVGLASDPQFIKAYGHYDWRNHVPESIQKMWKELTMESRVVAYLVAESEARKETWKD